MQTLFSRALWGMTESHDLAEQFRIVKEGGYDGVEANILDKEPARIRDLCAEHDLAFVAQIFPLSPAEHRVQCERAVAAGAVRIVSHSGRDRWTENEARAFWKEVLPFEQDLPVPVGHETHRYRMFYAPWSTARHLEEFPTLHVTLDLSHWCVVCESMLDDMQDFVDLAIARAVHLHARVGHEEGPQVSDPAAPEWAGHLARHALWWDTLRARLLTENAPLMTVTPEFGPPNYQWTLPYTRQPLSDLAAVNHWMREWLKARWKL